MIIWSSSLPLTSYFYPRPAGRPQLDRRVSEMVRMFHPRCVPTTPCADPLPPQPQAAQGYDPRRSNVKEDALAEFIRAPITGDLKEVRAA
jgi:hypothetical protein